MLPLASQATVATVGVVLPFLYLVWCLSERYLYTYFSRKTTVLHEIESLGESRPADKQIKGTAVIIGGSIAGLWSALVAADHFEDVLIVEPESWLTGIGKSNQYNAEGIPIREDEAPPRTRVAQFAFCHLYQPMVFSVLSKYFPRFREEIEEAGGRIGPFNISFLVGGKVTWRMRKSNLKAEYKQSLFISRDGYERVLRRLVLDSTSRIKWLTGTVTGFNAEPENTSILSSLEVRLPEGRTNIYATLVIDCSGSTQIGLKLLRRIAPKDMDRLSWENIKTSFDCGIRYAMFRAHVPTEARDSLPIPGGYYNRSWFYSSLPIPGKTNLVLYVNKAEGHRMNFLFGGWGDPQLPESVDEIKSWCEAFEVDHAKIPDWVYVLFDELLIKGDNVRLLKIRAPEQQWTLWDSAPYLPSNYIAIGDSVQVTNPMYGQGCLKAATGAIIFDGMLRKKPFSDSTEMLPGFGRQFFKRQREVLEPIWESDKPADYMFPTTKPIEGESLSKCRLRSIFGNLVMEVAAYDDEVDNALFNVRTLMAPPQSFFHPRLLLKYAIFIIRKYLGFLPALVP